MSICCNYSRIIFHSQPSSEHSFFKVEKMVPPGHEVLSYKFKRIGFTSVFLSSSHSGSILSRKLKVITQLLVSYRQIDLLLGHMVYDSPYAQFLNAKRLFLKIAYVHFDVFECWTFPSLLTFYTIMMSSQTLSS